MPHFPIFDSSQFLPYQLNGPIQTFPETQLITRNLKPSSTVANAALNVNVSQSRMCKYPLRTTNCNVRSIFKLYLAITVMMDTVIASVITVKLHSKLLSPCHLKRASIMQNLRLRWVLVLISTISMRDRHWMVKVTGRVVLRKHRWFDAHTATDLVTVMLLQPCFNTQVEYRSNFSMFSLIH